MRELEVQSSWSWQVCLEMYLKVGWVEFFFFFFKPPPLRLLNSTLPPCACLVFLHFSLSVSDLASFLLSLFHSDSPDGKLISTVWEQTYRQTQTAPDSTGASSSPTFSPLLLAFFLSTYLHLSSHSSSCLHTHPFSKWKRPVSCLLSVLSSSPGPFFPSFVLPSILGAAAVAAVAASAAAAARGGDRVDSSGWWVEDCVEQESSSGPYLLGMQHYGLW